MGIKLEKQPLTSGSGDDCSRPGSGTVAWLSKALFAVLDATVGVVLERIPVHVIVALVLCLTAALLVASAKDAQAEIPGLIPDGQLESPGALGLAVDQSTEESDPSHGDLYAAGFFGNLGQEDQFLGRVNRFDALGNLLSPPSPIGLNMGVLAYGGAAVNPVNGDVYALNAVEHAIDVFEPMTGAPLGSFPVEPTGGYSFGAFPLSVVGIAADSDGNVYVPVAPKDEVLEYSPSGTFVMQLGKEVDETKVERRKEQEAKSEPVTVTKEEEDACTSASGDKCAFDKEEGGQAGSGGGEFNGPTGIAVDPARNLWVADAGNNRIEELTSSGESVAGGVIPSEGVGSVAVDAHGDVYAIDNNSRDFCGTIKPPCSHLVEYDPAGTQTADLGASVIGAKQFGPETPEGRDQEQVPDMVAVSDATGEVYVSEAVLRPEPGGTSGRVLRYRPPVAPTLGAESAVEVSAGGAKLGAVVSPGGLDASYHFEYGPTSAYGRSVPVPAGNTGAGFASRTVWAGVSGLEPGATYHYRVVVTGALGEPLMGEDHTFTTHPAVACPNDVFRTGYSAHLPDCRAYELVTPPNKDSAQPDKNQGTNGAGTVEIGKTLDDNVAAVNGNRLAFRSEDVLPGSISAGESYVSTRGAGGWSSGQNVFPPADDYGFKCTDGQLAAGYSEDLSEAIVKVHAGGGCAVDPELVAGEPHGYELENLFVRDNTTGKYQLIDVTPEGVVPATPSLLGESPDFSRLVFSEEATLTPGAPAGVEDVYEWSAGHVALVTVLPGGAPVAGSYAGISADGSRVFFAAGGALYARINGAETVQLDASQAGGPGGGGVFVKAGHDGSVVLFTDNASAALTSDTVPGSGTNLYRYDASAPAGSRLTDLTPVAHAEAPVVGGMSKDGSVVFFIDDASAALTPNTKPGSEANLYRWEAAAPAGLRLADLTPAEHAAVQNVLGVGEEAGEHRSSPAVYFTALGKLPSLPNPNGEEPQSGHSNVYLCRGAGTAFIVTGAGNPRVSPNGAYFLFESNQELTAYDNENPVTETPATELYLYDAVANTLACASCNPSGAPPTAFTIRGKARPGGPDSEGGALEGRAQHPLSENGQVFFDSAEELLPADTNGQSGCSEASGLPACTDVYEFEPDGVGTCVEPAGCLYLLSTGTGALETFFIDASPSGNDVFIREFQKLLPSDTQDEAPSLYDVRVNGGFPEPASSPCTTPEACRTAPSPQPAVFGAPASQTFSGAGNLPAPPPAVKPPPVSCKKGYVKQKGKCVKKKPKKKDRKSNRASRKRGR